MTDSVTISMVGAVATVAVALLNAVFAFLSARQGKRNEQHIVQAKDALQTLEVRTNGMQEKLLLVTAQAEHAKGVKQAEDDATIVCRYKAADDRFPGK